MTEKVAASAASLPDSPATTAAAFFAQAQAQPGTAFFFPPPPSATAFYPGGPSSFLHPSSQPAASAPTGANVAVPPSSGGGSAGGVIFSNTCPPFVAGVCPPQLFPGSSGNVVAVGSGPSAVPSAYSSRDDVPSLLGAGGMHQSPLLPAPGKRSFPGSGRPPGEEQQPPVDFGSGADSREWPRSSRDERRDSGGGPGERERNRDKRDGGFPVRDPRRDHGGGSRRGRASEEEDGGWGSGPGRRRDEGGREDERWRRTAGSGKASGPLGDTPTHLGIGPDDRHRGTSPHRGEDTLQKNGPSLHNTHQPPLLSSPPGWDTNTPSHDNSRRHMDFPGASSVAPAPHAWADIPADGRGHSRRNDVPLSRNSRPLPRSSSLNGREGGGGESPSGVPASRGPHTGRRRSPGRFSPRSRRGDSPRLHEENRRTAAHSRGGPGPGKAPGGRRGGRGVSLPQKRRRGQRQSDDSRGSPSVPRRRGSPSIQRPADSEHPPSRSSSVASWPPVRSNSSVSMDRGSDDSLPRGSGDKPGHGDTPDFLRGGEGGVSKAHDAGVAGGGEEGNRGFPPALAAAARVFGRDPDGNGAADWVVRRPSSGRGGGERGKGEGAGEKKTDDKDEKKKGEAFDLWVPTTFHPSFTQRVRLVLGPKGRTHKEMEQLAKMRVQIYGNEMVRCTTKHGYDSFRDNQPLHLLVSFDRARRHGATADTPRRAREVLESFLEQLVERTWPRDEQRPVQTFYDKQVAMGPSHGPLVYVHPLGQYDEPPPKELEDCLVYRPTGIVRGPGRKAGDTSRRGECRGEEEADEDEADQPYEGDPTMLLNCTPPLCLLLLTLQSLHALLWEDGAQEIRQLPASFEQKWDVCLLHRREDFQAACVDPERQAKGLGPATDKPAADDGYGGLLSFVQEFPEVFEILPESSVPEGKPGAEPRFDRVKVRAKESPNFAHVAHRFKTTNPWLGRGN